jgi:hypothetical protein
MPTLALLTQSALPIRNFSLNASFAVLLYWCPTRQSIVTKSPISFVFSQTLAHSFAWTACESPSRSLCLPEPARPALRLPEPEPRLSYM